MAIFRNPFFRGETGDFGSPITGRICKPPQGTAGRDDPNQQGRIFAACHDIPPMMGQANPSPGQINQAEPTEMIGKTYHQDWLDEMTCYGTRFPDGSICWQGMHAQWSGGATPQGSKSGATGTPRYPGRGEKK